MIEWAVAFVAMFLFEICWVMCIDAVHKDQAGLATVYGAGTWITTGLCTIGYTTDPWLLVPTVLGASAGTYFTMKGKKWISRVLARFSTSASQS